MYNLLKSDLYKLKYSKELKLSLLLIILLGTINILSQVRETGKLMFISEFSDMFGLMGCTLFAGMFIGKEFTNRTIYHPVMTGCGRSSILFSKFLTYWFGCFIILGVNLILNGGVYSIIYGWGQPMVTAEWLFIIKYSFLHVIFNLCLTSAAFFISVLIKDTGMATAVCSVGMGIFLAVSQMFWNGLNLYLAQGSQSLGSAPIILAFMMIFIPIGVVLISTVLFNKQDIK